MAAEAKADFDWSVGVMIALPVYNFLTPKGKKGWKFDDLHPMRGEQKQVTSDPVAAPKSMDLEALARSFGIDAADNSDPLEDI